MDELIDYSLYDINGDAYVIKVKRHEAAKYDVDHIASYRMLNKLKRSCVQPTRRDNGETSAFAPNHNSTMQMMVEHCPSPILNVDDLRSPLVKKGRRDNSEVLNTSFEMIQLDDNMEELATPLQAEELATPFQAELEDPVTYEWPKHVVHTLINELGKRIGEFKFQKKQDEKKYQIKFGIRTSDSFFTLPQFHLPIFLFLNSKYNSCMVMLKLLVLFEWLVLILLFQL